MNNKLQPGDGKVNAADDRDTQGDGIDGEAPAVEPKDLTPAAQRALAEAAQRREAEQLAARAKAEDAKELGGRNGPEPTRYGDWEKGGIASDF